MNRKPKLSPSRLYLHGLKSTASGNAHAFGFSILITVSYGVVSAAAATPKPAELFGFALSAIAAFSLLNLAIALLARRPSEELDSARVKLVATATDFIAVGAGVAAAFGSTLVAYGWAVWVLAPWAAGTVYLFVQALEFALGKLGSEEA
jgi:hypothetical protein